jgi:hypothetical protein
MAEEKQKTDYQGNSRNQKDKEKKKEVEPLEPVVTDSVLVKKRSWGRRAKDMIIEMDVKSVSKYVFLGVLIPAVKNMMFDAGTETMRRMMFRDPRGPQGGHGINAGTRYNYQTPVSRPYTQPSSRYGPPNDPGPRLARYNRDDIILVDRNDADLVLERMHDVLEQVEVVTLRDLNELINRPATYVDENWGWTDLRGSRITQIREGYLLELPPIQALK